MKVYEFSDERPLVEYGTWEYTVREDVREAILRTQNQTTNMRFMSVLEVAKSDGERHVCVELTGGLNGHGDWNDYLLSIGLLMSELSRKYDVYVVQLINDCLDDVFDLVLGIQER